MTALPPRVLADLDARLADDDAERERRYPGPPVGRTPAHTVYVPADRVTPDLPARWGSEALAALAEHGPLPDAVADQHDRVVARLRTAPVADLRVDLEDGYGLRPEDDEDADAVAAARALAAMAAGGTGPDCCGVRVKSLEPATRARGVRSLDLVVGTLAEAGPLPDGFRVTVPKMTSVAQVQAVVALCEALEDAHGLAAPLRFEIQVETPQAVLGADGRALVAPMLHAAAGRCAGLHYGTYDYSASLGVAAPFQSMEHPVADHAKAVMLVAAAATGVPVSDGSTNVLPVGSTDQVRSAWALHARLVTRSLEAGFYQGWDLHPAQLPTRWAATFAFYRASAPAVATRLRSYLTAAGSGLLDEPATAAAMAGFLARGLDAGALDAAEVEAGTGLGTDALMHLARRVRV
ncbi:aldolase/citrate lyase family protein [Rhodococcus aerolatus]